MPSLAPDAEPQRPAAMVYTPQDDVHARLKALELQLTLEAQRQRDQFEEEVHKLQQQLLTISREHQHQQQATLARTRDSKNCGKRSLKPCIVSPRTWAVQRSTLGQTSRAVERLRHELLETLFERDHTTVQRHMLGELFMTLGRQLQEDAPGEVS